MEPLTISEGSVVLRMLVRAHQGGEDTGLMEIELVYRRASPYEVEMRWTDRPARWRLARETLAQGADRGRYPGGVSLTGADGEAEIDIRPTAGQVQVTLTGLTEDGVLVTLRLDLPRERVEGFLAAADEMIAPGTEADEFDSRAALAELFED